MEKIIDKIFREEMFENKHFLRIEDTIKRYVRDIRVDLKIWKKYNIGDEYNEQQR